MIVHAGCVARWSSQGWRGVLIEGPSGSGKSDLALRLLEDGWRLVSDDRTGLWASGGRLFAACPAPIAGLIEARGVGLVEAVTVRLCAVALVVRCLPPGEAPERMPDPETVQLCGLAAPLLHMRALEASAPAKLRRALASLGQSAQGAYQAAAVQPRGRGSR